MTPNPSSNFAFLGHHDPRLVALGTQAEEHFANDPNVTLFRGELVAQDSNDEPAEAMLARARSRDSRRSLGSPATTGATPANGSPPTRGRPRARQRFEQPND